MLPDTKLKDYYYQFVYDAKVSIAKYNEILKTTKTAKEECYNYLKLHEDKIKNLLGIILTNYTTEWINKKYNADEKLYKRVNKLLIENTNKLTRPYVIELIKYCNLLNKENKYIKEIEYYTKCKNIKITEYRTIITTFFNKVHACVLNGNGYKFSNGLGTYLINHWKVTDNPKVKKRCIDYAATNAKKKELLAQGKKLYDDKEAAWYEARHIPYDGVDYRVYKDYTYYYEFAFINSSLVKVNSLEYQRTEYVSIKYRGMSYTAIADKFCKTKEDIYNLQVDIKYKLNILLYKYPINYTNFIRNANESKYQYRAYNS